MIIRNLLVFLSVVIPRLIPPWRWPAAWRLVEDAHRQDVHKMIWELKKQGKIYEDTEGRLWSKK